MWNKLILLFLIWQTQFKVKCYIILYRVQIILINETRAEKCEQQRHVSLEDKKKGKENKYKTEINLSFTIEIKNHICLSSRDLQNE